MTRRRPLLPTLLLTVMLVPLTPAGAEDGTAPLDYTTLASQLSAPQHPEVIREELRVPMDDGIELHVEVTRPDPQAYPGLQVPVIMEASPYHGTFDTREGAGLLPHPVDDDGEPLGLTGYFPPRGYAVVMVDLRGTGQSAGCLDHLGPRDAADLKAIVEWAATREWSSGRVGLIGHSYPSITAATAVAQRPDGLSTAVLIAGAAQMYDHQFHHGVPYFLQYVGPIAGYPALTLARYGPIYQGEMSEQLTYAHCGALSSAALAGTGQVTGQYEAWHAERDHRQGAIDADIPLFVVHGVEDDQVRMPSVEWFLTGRTARPGDKLWLGPWGHGAAAHARPVQWQHALHAWFDRHLLGRSTPTGPAAEAFFDTGAVTAADAWTTAAEELRLHADASDMSLRLDAPDGDAEVTFAARGNIDALTARFGFGTGVAHDDGGVEFTSDPLSEDVVLLGMPQLHLRTSLVGEVVHLVVSLWREGARGRHMVGVCAMQPQLREGVDTVTPVIPGEVMDLRPQCAGMAHHITAGERLVLRVGTGSRHHVSAFGAGSAVTIHTGPDATTHTLPLRPEAELHPDPAPTG